MKKIVYLFFAILIIVNADSDYFDKDVKNFIHVKSSGSVRIRKEPNLQSTVIGYLKKGEIVEVYATKTYNNEFYPLKNGGYISAHYVYIVKNIDKTIAQNMIKSRLNQAFGIHKISKTIKKAKINKYNKASSVKIAVNKSNLSKKNMYAYNARIAKTNREKTLLANITKLPSPTPVMEQPKYARILFFPYLSEDGNAYYDYSYSWVKIKNEQFILGNQQNNHKPFFGINME